MPIKPQTARRFDGSTAVARYWLAHCEGFRVRGPLKGTVEQVLASPDLQNAQALVVRTRGRRLNIPVEAVDVVVPAAREIVLEAEPAAPTAAAARERARTLARSGAHSLADVVKALAILLAVGAATVARVLVALAAHAVHVAALAGSRVRADLHARQLASRRPGQH